MQNGAGDGGTRGWIAGLDAKTGDEKWRFYTVPKPGDPGSETWKDDHNAWKTGGGGIWQTGAYDPATHLYIVGTGNPYPIYDPQFRPGDNLYTNSAIAIDVRTGKLAWHFQYTPNDSWDFDEVGVHMLYDIKIDGVLRKVVGHYARNGFYYTLDRTNGKFIRSEKYVNDLNWTKGIDQKTGKPFEYNPKLDVQIYNPEARALRGDGQKRTCPTWHGGIAHQPLSYNPVKQIAYGVGTEGCFSQNGAAVGSLGPDGGVDPKKSEPRKYSSDLYYGAVTAFDAANHKVLAKVATDIEIRSGVIDTAGGVLFTALQDGWLVAYNDDTLEAAVAVQRRHAAQGRAGHLLGGSEAVRGGADERSPPAPGEVRQPRELVVPVRVRGELGDDEHSASAQALGYRLWAIGSGRSHTGHAEHGRELERHSLTPEAQGRVQVTRAVRALLELLADVLLLAAPVLDALGVVHRSLPDHSARTGSRRPSRFRAAEASRPGRFSARLFFFRSASVVLLHRAASL